MSSSLKMSEERVFGPFVPRLTGRDLRELGQSRELLVLLGLRDLKSRYRQTALGVSWVILQPLIAAATFTFVFSRVAHLSAPGTSYFIFVFSGLLAWTFFSSHLTRTGQSLVANGGLVSKIYFSRLALPASVAISSGVDLAVGLAVLGVSLIVTGSSIGLPILLAPVWLLLLLLLSSGLGVVLGGIQVYYRDAAQVVTVGIQLLLFLSPVAYSSSQVPAAYRVYYHLNPIAPLIEGFRWSLGQGPLPQTNYLVYGAVAAVICIVLGPSLFKRMEGGFADVI